MKIGVLFIIITAGLFLASSVSAELLIEQPSYTYNIGDEFNISVTVNSLTNTDDFFLAKLVCNSGEKDIYKSPESIKAGEQKTVFISARLREFLTDNFTGECYVKADYGSDEAISQKFYITNEVEINLEINGALFNPGEVVRISGEAIKKNGQLLNGFVQLSVSELNFSVYLPISKGKFSFNFTIPEYSYARTYNIIANAYEKDSSGEIINEGNATASIRVKQIARKIDLEFSLLTIKPGDDLAYTIRLYDQAGEDFKGDASVIVYKPDKSVFQKKLVKAGEPNTIKTTYNSTPDYWKIEAKAYDLTKEKGFYIEKAESASFDLVNRSLIVTNTGNVPYNRLIEVSIGEINELKEIKLELGQTKQYKLSAPKGEYEVSIKDGSKAEALGMASLTGGAISVGDVTGLIKSNSLIFAWVALIIILLLIILLYYRKIRKKSYFGQTPKLLAPIKIVSAPKINADNAMADKGEREEAVMIALNIKNYDILTKNDPDIDTAINNVLYKAKEAKAKIYLNGDYRIMIFSHLLTGEDDNNIRAVNVAKDIQASLSDQALVKKMKFGIGIHSGEIIVEIKEGKFKLTSIGNIIPAVKKIAEYSNSDILMSEKMHRRVMGAVQAERLSNLPIWRIKKIANRDENTQFIDNFLKRQRR